MNEMISYLKDYREEVPAWLSDYLQGKQFSFKDIMSSRVGYYPGSEYDGTLIKVGNMSHSVHSFLYVDYLVNGQYPYNITKEPLHGKPNTFVDPDEKPYCFSLIMERDKDRDDSWGAEHFVVTFLYADGIATYYQLFVKEYSKAPWIFLLQDHGFGCNYDCFGRGGLLDCIIRENHCYPQYVICASNTRIWNGYEQIKDVSPVYGGMHQHRRDLFVFCPAIVARSLEGRSKEQE